MVRLAGRAGPRRGARPIDIPAADDPVHGLLRRSACAAPDPESRALLHDACGAQRNWDTTIREAEQHGLAPWLHRQIRASEAPLPELARRQLAALGSRHARSNAIRGRALVEISESLQRRDIPMLALKGSALAHLIYPAPGLRPMRDIDLLVAPQHLASAAEVMAGLGYIAPGRERLLPDHHHLPGVSRSMDGLSVSVEIHHDALTRDNFGSLRLGSLSESPRAFMVGDATLHTLGHLDMLRHLCRHMLEPAAVTKIGSALDIMLYAVHFAEQIDWQRLRAEFPEVGTTIQMLGYLVPWPGPLQRYLPGPTARAPQGVGCGVIPLSRLRHRRDWLIRLLNPSDWWLHAFYNVPPGHSLATTRALRHPLRVMYWLWRRRGARAA